MSVESKRINLAKTEQLNKALREFIKSGETSCLSIAAAVDQELDYTFNEGLSRSKDLSSAISQATQFNIGSVTKPITGSLIIKLIEMGKLAYDDPVQKFIPKFKESAITISHLLTHTSGLMGLNIPWPQESELDSYKSSIYELEITFAAGERCEYFTFGYAILMDIIEQVTGNSLEEFAQTHLFIPLHMLNTTYDTRQLEQHRYVLPYLPDQSDWDDKLDRLAATGDSGLYTTAEDLIKFGNMLLKDGELDGMRVFSESSVQFMLHEATNNQFHKTPVFWRKGQEDSFGCFGALNSQAAIGHPGFSGCMLMLDPELKRVVAIVSNSQKLHANWANYKQICDLILSD